MVFRQVMRLLLLTGERLDAEKARRQSALVIAGVAKAPNTCWIEVSALAFADCW